MKTNIALLIFFLIIALWAGIAFWGSSTSKPLEISWKIASQTPLIFGVIPYDAEQSLAHEFSSLSIYLHKHLGREVKLMVASSYKSLGQLLDTGNVEIARFSLASYERSHDASNWEILCWPVISGKVFSRGIIVTSANGPVHTLEDLQGKHFAFVDPYSETGCIKAKSLFKARGIEPLTFFSKISFSGNHSASLNGVRTGLYDAAVVVETSLPKSNLKSEDESFAQEIRILGFTEWIMTDPIVVRKDMSAELKSKLKDLFVKMKDHELGASVAADLKSSSSVDRFLAEDEALKLLPPDE